MDTNGRLVTGSHNRNELVLINAAEIGRCEFVYLLSGFSGSVLSSLFIRESISVGASGALFGLLGAMLSELITNWTLFSNKVLNVQVPFLFKLALTCQLTSWR